MDSKTLQKEDLLASKRVPKITAEKWTKHWRNSKVLLSGNDTDASLADADGLNGNEKIIDKVYAFNIPIDDIVTLLSDFGVIDRSSVKKEHDFKFIRTYLGIDKKDQDDFKNTDMKLLVVMTDKNGKDLIYKNGGEQDTLNERQSEIFDLTSPCPDTCDDTSPLIRG